MACSTRRCRWISIISVSFRGMVHLSYDFVRCRAAHTHIVLRVHLHQRAEKSIHLCKVIATLLFTSPMMMIWLLGEVLLRAERDGPLGGKLTFRGRSNSWRWKSPWMLLTTQAILGLFVIFNTSSLLLLILEIYIDRLHISWFLLLKWEVAALALSELLFFLLLKLF